ncbi:MAG: oligosaccharide flippase family protein [Bacteroidota bacterium]
MKGITALFKRISQSGGAESLAVNTLIIYTQRLTAAVLSLVTTPIILNALGVEDYGIYTLTIGLVGMLAFLNWSLSSATQRYIAFALGEGKTDKLKRIFVSTLSIHGIYGIILLIIISTIGAFFVDELLTIPINRIEAAKTILIVVSVITFVNIITVPFIGVFRAHENFLYLAILGIIESLLKLGIAVALLFVSADKLVFYTLLMLGSTLLIFGANFYWGKKFYGEINFNPGNLDKALIKEMLSFMGWSLVGALAILSRNQAVSVLLNMFFGVIKNAAYGIAMQVNAAVAILSQGIITAVSPRIIKSAGAGENDKMIYLMRTMSKLAVLSVSIVVLPFFFEASFILKLWLKNVPEDAVLFSKLILGFGLIMLQSAGIQAVFDAIGKVKVYNLWVSVILILNIPVSYVLFLKGFPAYSIILVGMILEVISLFVRLLLLKKYLNFSIPAFLSDVFIRIGLPMVVICSVAFLIKDLGRSDFQQLVITFLLFLTVYPVGLYFLSLDRSQKEFIDNSLTRLFKPGRN